MNSDHFQCDFCSEVFESEDDTMEHIKSEHNNANDDEPPAVYVCNYCTHTCKLRSGMHVHYSNFHEDEFVEKPEDDKKLKSDECSVKSNAQDSVNKHKEDDTMEHINSEHSNSNDEKLSYPNVFICNYCTHLCKSLSDMHVHYSDVH